MSSLVAATSTDSGASSLLIFALPVLLIAFVIFTQRRRTKEVQRLQSTLAIGDDVVTTSGLLGRITLLDDEIATLEVAPGVSLRFNRRAIAGPLPTTSATSASETDASSDPSRPTD